MAGLFSEAGAWVAFAPYFPTLARMNRILFGDNLPNGCVLLADMETIATTPNVPIIPPSPPVSVPPATLTWIPSAKRNRKASWSNSRNCFDPFAPSPRPTLSAQAKIIFIVLRPFTTPALAGIEGWSNLLPAAARGFVYPDRTHREPVCPGLGIVLLGGQESLAAHQATLKGEWSFFHAFLATPNIKLVAAFFAPSFYSVARCCQKFGLGVGWRA
jgi:hypothetical protein